LAVGRKIKIQNKEEEFNMPTKLVNASLSEADAQAIEDAFAAVLAKLPFVVNLTAEERKSGAKTGNEGLSFVKNALAAAQSNPSILPASFDTAGFQRDVALFEALMPLATLAASVASQIDDTRMAAGKDAMQQAILAYSYVKTAAKTTPGLKPVAEQLGERFKRAGRPKTPPVPPV
jgi:hypothetical protein